MFDAYIASPEQLKSRRERREGGKTNEQPISAEAQAFADHWVEVMQEGSVEQQTAQNVAETETANQIEEGESVGEEVVESQENTIQHFEQEGNSSFEPLSPEQQRALSQETENQSTIHYSQDNLVTQAVQEDAADGKIDLNSVGQKLEGNGVDIQREVEDLNSDIANDIAESGGDGSEESMQKQAEVANALAVDDAAMALSLKEQAADTISAIEHGDADAEARISQFEQNASEANNLTEVSESTALQAAVDTTNTTSEARKIIDEAEEVVKASQDKSEAENSEENDGDNDEDEGNSEFNAANYPELNELGSDNRNSIFA